MNRRVAVTGIGVIEGPGKTRNEFWKALANGESSIRPMTLVPEGVLRFSNAAEVPDYRATDYFDEKQADYLDRFAQFAVIAAREALADAGITITPDLAEQTAVVTGTSTGGQTSEDAQFRELYEAHNARIHPLTIARTMTNAATSAITREFGIVGPSLTIATACSSANHAIGQAFWMVRNGTAEVAVAGGRGSAVFLGISQGVGSDEDRGSRNMPAVLRRSTWSDPG